MEGNSNIGTEGPAVDDFDDNNVNDVIDVFATILENTVVIEPLSCTLCVNYLCSSITEVWLSRCQVTSLSSKF